MFDPRLVHEFLSLNAKEFPNKAAIIYNEEKWVYRDIDIATNKLAILLTNLGICRHDRVVVFLDNSPETVIAIYGILKVGAIFIVLNSTLKSNKLNYILKDSGAVTIITHTNKSEVVRRALQEESKVRNIIWVGNKKKIPIIFKIKSVHWDEIFNERDISSFNNNVRIIDQDLATLIYTSGSTGEPKGVISTHFNMISAAKSIIQYLENTSDDIILNVLPLSFDYGLYQIIMAFIFGGTVVLEKSFLFSDKLLKIIENEKVTGFPIVPTILALLLRLKNLNKYNLNSLRYMTNTGAALPVAHIKTIRKLLPHVKFYSMYGLTECKRVSYMPPEELDKRPDSVGIPMPNCEVFILDEKGKEVSPGEIGELVVRGSNVMLGYWNSPELTTEVYRDGVYRGEKLLFTGDLFRKDKDGFLYFVGRKDDMIKTKGERVSPKEIENEICKIPGVNEVAVIGLPDEILGQAIKAFVVVENGISLTKNDILKHCSKYLEPFMVPKYIEFIDALPKTSNGKIDKKALANNKIKTN